MVNSHSLDYSRYTIAHNEIYFPVTNLYKQIGLIEIGQLFRALDIYSMLQQVGFRQELIDTAMLIKGSMNEGWVLPHQNIWDVN